MKIVMEKGTNTNVDSHVPEENYRLPIRNKFIVRLFPNS